MKIGDKSPSGIGNLYARQLQATDPTQRDAAASKGQQAASSSSSEKDQVQISPEAHALHKGIEAAMTPEDVRWDKVNQLRHLIAQRAYEVPAEALAKRLLPDSQADE